VSALDESYSLFIWGEGISHTFLKVIALLSFECLAVMITVFNYFFNGILVESSVGIADAVLVDF
jgi:hypothetical protein